MTPTEIQTAILENVGEPEGIFHTVANILPLVQHGELLLGIARGLTEKTISLPLVYNQPDYLIHATAADFVVPLRVTILRKQLFPTTLSRVTDRDLRWTASVGTPTHYFLIGATRLAFYPTAPSSTLTASVTYAALPPQVNGVQSYLVGSEWHEALVHYGAALLLAKEQKYEPAAQQLNLFLTKGGLPRDTRMTGTEVRGEAASQPQHPAVEVHAG